MFRRSHYIAIAGVALVALGLLSLPANFVRPVRLATAGLFLPLFGVAGAVQDLAARVPGLSSSRAALAADLARLEQENQQLRLELVSLAQAQRENDELRQLVNWQRQAPWRTRLARVVGRDPANWWRTLQIDLGSRDGVRVNLPVMTAEGLVGRVAEVGWTHSLVALVGDPNCRVSAWILDTRDHGIVVPGVSSTDPQVAHLSFLPKNEQIHPGQWVVTSGLGLFPSGIPIGKVLDVRRVGYGVYTEARVKLSAPLGRLREVWVVWP
jgi:rod shape-determining protein MreC